MAKKSDPWLFASKNTLLERLDGHLSVRKIRLAACACVRRLPATPTTSIEQVIQLAERFADGKATPHELAAARYGGRFQPGHPAWAVCWAQDESPWAMLERTISWVEGVIAGPFSQLGAMVEQQLSLADALREIASDPSDPVVLDPAWLAWNQATIPALARGIYEERAFDQMPILGDALEEAGCADQRILEHCRSGKDHVRGCWLLDVILGL